MGRKSLLDRKVAEVWTGIVVLAEERGPARVHSLVAGTLCQVPSYLHHAEQCVHAHGADTPG